LGEPGVCSTPSRKIALLTSAKSAKEFRHD
jgi:hypothetical protein